MKNYLEDWQRQAFRNYFHTDINNFWNILFGFDIVQFDKDFLKTPDNKSVSDTIIEKYGEDANNFLSSILGIIPLKNLQ